MADVAVTIGVDNKAAISGLKQVGDNAEDVGSRISGAFGKAGSAIAGMAKIAGGIIIAEGLMKLPGFLLGAAKAAAEDEAAMIRLQQTFRNYADMVGASEGTFEALNGLLNERIKIGQDLAFTDDQVRDSFNALLVATDDSTEATKRQSAAFDLARGAHIPLEQATKLLGKITAENVEVFKRMGITIGENATEAEALAAVQARFGGQAEAYAKSTAGQFEQTQIRMGELKEQIGAQLLPVMNKIGTVLVEDVIPKLEQFGAYWQENISPKIAKFWEDTKPKLEAVWKYIQDVVMPAVQENFAKFQAYYESDIKPALENIKAGILAVVEYLKLHWAEIEAFVKPMLAAIQLGFENMILGIQIAIDILGGDWEEAWAKMGKVFENDINAWELLWKAWVAGWKLQVDVVTDIFDGMNKAIVASITAAVQGSIQAIIELINKAITAYNSLPLAPNIATIPTKTAPSVLPVFGPPAPIQGPSAPIQGPMPPSQNPFAGDVQQIQLVVDGAVLAQVVTNQLARAM